LHYGHVDPPAIDVADFFLYAHHQESDLCVHADALIIRCPDADDEVVESIANTDSV